MRLNHFTLTVSDVATSARFYEQLGLKQIVAQHPGYARFLSPCGEVTLSLQRAGSRPIHPTASVHFEVADVDAVVRALGRRGFTFARQPADQPYLWREAVLLDPDGYEIYVYRAGENRLSPPWRL